MGFIAILLFILPFVLIIGMADQSLSTRGYYQWQQGGKPLGPNDLVEARTNGTDIKIGHIVTHTGETLPDVDLAITTDGRPLGVVVGPVNLKTVLDSDPDWNPDTALPDNTKIWVAKLGCGAIGPVHLEATAGPLAVVKGTTMLAVGTEAGKVRNFAYTDATAATDSLIEVVGTAHESSAGSATDDLVILMRLDK